ncbi:hypothetical protein FSARC_830 [Fusarium sarcochroum]|uniref:Mixed-linked glucanase MLG1 n=1 Tax=Fusarium sarcochroum TaxID=1208366 RepID=A0A8H4UA61_9HYPO|nr:hypothetical protein FSARC_830 [Fusarium sarcochroum]
MAYSLATSYMGDSLISGFNWYNGPDPSNGFVQYQSLRGALDYGLYSVEPFSQSVRLGVDSSRRYDLDEGRPSFRLESKESYQYGLFIGDFEHMPPSQCGTWPAFWAYGTSWPDDGEIDILEGANLAYNNIMTGHTAEGCMLDPADENLFSGERLSLDCGVGMDNVGCGFNPPESDKSSYGDTFNAIGGGVYAMEWDSEYIKIWHFPRGSIPADIEAKKPDPRKWGLPQSLFGGSKCNVDEYFKDLKLVLNINFCGDYGEGTWRDFETCRSLAPTCREYVAKNPRAFQDAYFDVNYINVYTRLGGSIPPVIPSSSKETSAQVTEPTDGPNTSATGGSSPSNPNTPISGNMGGSTMSVPSNNSISTRPPSPKEDSSSTGEPMTTTTMTGVSTILVTIPGSGTDSATVSPLPVATGGRSVNPASIGDYSYLGCFGSETGFQTFKLTTESDDMTIEQCIQACGGLTYIGIFEGSCYCASKLDGDTRAIRNETTCNRPCPGDEDQFCGGLVTQGTRNRLKRSIPLRRDAPNNVLLTVYADISDAGQPEVPPAMGPGGTTASSGEAVGETATPIASSGADVTLVDGSDDLTTLDGEDGTSVGGSAETTAPSDQDSSLPSNLVELSVSDDLAAGTSVATETAVILGTAAVATDTAVVVGAGVAADTAVVIGTTAVVTDTAVVIGTTAVVTDTAGVVGAGAAADTAVVIGTAAVVTDTAIVFGTGVAADTIVVVGTGSDNQVIEAATQAIPDTDRKPVISTITYFTVLPSNPGSLVPQESIVTLWYEQCSCKNPDLIQPPMATRTIECDGCGPNGENTVTLTVPISVTVTVPGATTGQTEQTNDAEAEADDAAAAGAASYGSGSSPEKTKDSDVVAPMVSDGMGGNPEPTKGSDAVAPVVPDRMGGNADQGQMSPEVTTIVMTYLTTRIITYGTATDQVSTQIRTARRTIVVTISNPSDGNGDMSILPVVPSPGQPNTPVVLATPTPGAPDQPVVVSGASSRRDDTFVLFAIAAMAVLAILL